MYNIETLATSNGQSTKMAAEASARRAGLATAAHWPSRARLGRRAWQEISRGARTLGRTGTLYAAEIHGVKVFFRRAESQQTPVETSVVGRRAASPARLEPCALKMRK